MRLLIYAFGPYRNFEDNVTEKILRRLPRRSRVRKVVFPVRFNKRQFIGAIKAYKPDVILGLGQCSRGRLLRIERIASNRRRNRKEAKARPIVRRGLRKLPTNFPLTADRRIRFSNNAGDYVCNYSMYVILDYLRRRRLLVSYGFIHVPCRYDLTKASRILTVIIRKLHSRA